VLTTLARIGDAWGLDPVGVRRLPIEIANRGRDDLAALFGQLGFTTGAEVGVEHGRYSVTLCKANPSLTLTCVDPWAAYSDQYRPHLSQAAQDAIFSQTVMRLAPFRCTVLRQFSVEAATGFADGSLDFVYLDGAHDLQSVIDDLTAWIPKVRVDGIISGHDWFRHRPRGAGSERIHVCEGLHAWTSAYGVRPWFIVGTQAIIPGETRDRPRSWFWVKA